MHEINGSIINVSSARESDREIIDALSARESKINSSIIAKSLSFLHLKVVDMSITYDEDPSVSLKVTQIKQKMLDDIISKLGDEIDFTLIEYYYCSIKFTNI